MKAARVFAATFDAAAMAAVAYFETGGRFAANLPEYALWGSVVAADRGAVGHHDRADRGRGDRGVGGGPAVAKSAEARGGREVMPTRDETVGGADRRPCGQAARC